jgi:DNA-binding PadR family transcriptional regulator
MAPDTPAQIPRLSRKEELILELLADGRERYGLELVASSNGGLKRGTVYVTLGRMEEKGYVVSRQEDKAGEAGLPRRLYRPTALGSRLREAWQLVRSRLAWRMA